MMKYTERDTEKEELYSIMRDLLQVEHDQESLICILRLAESAYVDEEQADAKLIVNGARFYLEASQEKLKMIINSMDLYIVGKVDKK